MNAAVSCPLTAAPLHYVRAPINQCQACPLALKYLLAVAAAGTSFPLRLGSQP